MRLLDPLDASSSSVTMRSLWEEREDQRHCKAQGNPEIHNSYFASQITRSSIFKIAGATLSFLFRGGYFVEQVVPQIGEKK